MYRVVFLRTKKPVSTFPAVPFIGFRLPCNVTAYHKSPRSNQTFTKRQLTVSKRKNTYKASQLSKHTHFIVKHKAPSKAGMFLNISPPIQLTTHEGGLHHFYEQMYTTRADTMSIRTRLKYKNNFFFIVSMKHDEEYYLLIYSG